MLKLTIDVPIVGGAVVGGGRGLGHIWNTQVCSRQCFQHDIVAMIPS